MSNAPSSRKPNRLASERSAYLRQHAYNPVDWFPWGPEAIDRARAEDKPIFLSVGYSTCYWCHVMERQCFENEQIAGLMNEKFVCVKVDREERADLDQLYMTAVQLLSGHGGWPMSVWLTPTLKPFYAGTYFPPTDMHGRAGFPTVLRALADAWENRREEVERAADTVHANLGRLASPAGPTETMKLDEAFFDELVSRSVGDHDDEHGGFGSAPKFPRQTLLELLLRFSGGETTADPQREARRAEVARRLRRALDAMSLGGIHDHLGGGVHRYSTDARWLIPHFEIMLYDQGMLSWVYAEACRLFDEPRYGRIARGICDFVLREMTDASGAFHAAIDAEVEAREGANYLWTREQVVATLTGEQHHRGDPADLVRANVDAVSRFCARYGLDAGPNFADPHHGDGKPHANVLFLEHPLSDEEEAEFAPLRARLLEARQRRVQPLKDTKVIVSWNALMIRGLAHVSAVLGEPRYLDAATRAANVLLTTHRRDDERLWRISVNGVGQHPAVLEDYAALAQACLDLHEISGLDVWREHAAGLALTMIRDFGADDHAGFFTACISAEDVIVRQRVAVDSPLPSGNAQAADVLLRLGHPQWTAGVLATFAPQLEQFGESMSALVQVGAEYARQFGAIVVPAGTGAPSVAPAIEPIEAVRIETIWLDPQRLQLTLRVRPGFHLGGHLARPPMLPTRVVVLPPDGALVEETRYPEATPRQFELSEETVEVLAGTVPIVLRLRAAPHRPMRLRVSYQPCDERRCLAATTRTITVLPPTHRRS